MCTRRIGRQFVLLTLATPALLGLTAPVVAGGIEALPSSSSSAAAPTVDMMLDQCGDIESLEVTCSPDKSKLRATVRSDLPWGTRLKLVGDEAFYRRPITNWWGTARATWFNPMPGYHEVCIEGCDICAMASCGCASDADCDDGDLCTVDECVLNECIATPIECGEGYVCVDGECVCDGPDCGLVAHYPFDGDLIDETGNGNDGTAYKGVSYCDGVMGTAVCFDGSTGYVELDENTNLDGFGEFTIAVWINPATDLNANTGRQDFLYKGPPVQWVTSYGLNYDDSDGKLMFPLPSASNWFSQTHIRYEAEFSANEWFHVVCTYDGVSIVHMYVNAVPVGAIVEEEGGVTGPMVDNTYPLTVGRRPDNRYYFNGAVDELRLYDRRLSQDEVQLLYESTIP